MQSINCVAKSYIHDAKKRHVFLMAWGIYIWVIYNFIWLPLLGLLLDLRFDAGVFELRASFTVMFTVFGLDG